MRVLVVGGGGREHALVARLAAERDVSELVAAPGNPGIAILARTVAVDVSRPDALLALADHEQIDLTVVGPELPLSVGVADAFAAARPTARRALAGGRAPRDQQDLRETVHAPASRAHRRVFARATRPARRSPVCNPASSAIRSC